MYASHLRRNAVISAVSAALNHHPTPENLSRCAVRFACAMAGAWERPMGQWLWRWSHWPLALGPTLYGKVLDGRRQRPYSSLMTAMPKTRPGSEPDGLHERAIDKLRHAQPRRGRRGSPVELDRLIHERVRLGIVSALALNDSLSFKELKSLLGTTDGNLSVHARRLEEAGYITCAKSFEGRVPLTQYRLTAEGRRAL